MCFSWKILWDGGIWGVLRALNSKLKGEIALQLHFSKKTFYVTLYNGILSGNSNKSSSIFLNEQIEILFPKEEPASESILEFLYFALAIEQASLSNLTLPPWFFPIFPEIAPINAAMTQKRIFLNAPPSRSRERFIRGWFLIHSGHQRPPRSGVFFIEELGVFATPKIPASPESYLIVSSYPLESLLEHQIIDMEIYAECRATRFFLPRACKEEEELLSLWEKKIIEDNVTPLFSKIRDVGLRGIIEEIEKKAIEWTFNRGEISQMQAAQMLKISRGSLQHKLKKYNIPYIQ